MVNAMTVDVEDYFHVQAFADVIAPEDWDNFPLRVERNTERILELFAAHHVRATFFVLGWVAERCPNLLSKICQAGHEVGCHGYWHRMITCGDAKDFRDDLKRAKDAIEERWALAREIEIGRAHV